MKPVLVLAFVLAFVLVTGCYRTINTSSRGFLAPADATARVALDTGATALEITRLFEVRGFTLAERQEHAGTVTLVLRAERSPHDAGDPVLDHPPREIGSVFWADIASGPSNTSTVTLEGRPLYFGRIPCGDAPRPNCTDVRVANGIDDVMTGREEANVIKGVMAQLGLEGHVVAR